MLRTQPGCVKESEEKQQGTLYTMFKASPPVTPGINADSRKSGALWE
jgi:hypothetical protein